jgi:hypothetical protein
MSSESSSLRFIFVAGVTRQDHAFSSFGKLQEPRTLFYADA